MTDLYYDDVSLLLSFDGVDEATTFVDASSTPKTGTRVGNTALDNAQSQFGATSAFFDGAADGISYNGQTLLDPTEALTIEAAVYFTDSADNQVIFSNRHASNNGGLMFYITDVDRKLHAIGYDGSGNERIGMVEANQDAVATGQWVHVALTRSAAGVWSTWVGGTLSLAATEGAGLGANTTPQEIGQDGNVVPTFHGYISNFRITKGVARYSSDFTAPTAAFPVIGPTQARIAIPSLVGAPAVVTQQIIPIDAKIAIPSLMGAPRAVVNQLWKARIAIPSILGTPSATVVNDFSALITDTTQRYIVRITGSPVIDVAVSSWQATLQTGRQNYVQCVVPAVTDQISDLDARVGSSEIVVYRTGYIGDTLVETEMARSPLSLVINNRGPFRDTATISGYSAATPPSASSQVLAMTGVRQTTQNLAGNSRVRCDIDWVLRPGQDVTADGLSFTANYINYFVPAVGDTYMDIGSRG